MGQYRGVSLELWWGSIGLFHRKFISNTIISRYTNYDEFYIKKELLGLCSKLRDSLSVQPIIGLAVAFTFYADVVFILFYDLQHGHLISVLVIQLQKFYLMQNITISS